MRTTHAQKQDAPSRVLLLDCHPVVLRGLNTVINEQPDLMVCGEALGAQGAVKIIEAMKPQLVITDIILQNGNGLELIKILSVRFPRIAILVFSEHEETLYAERALRAGAKGYIMKSVNMQMLLEAIRELLKGHVYLSNAMSDRIVLQLATQSAQRPIPAVELLSDRELEVLELIGQGYPSRRIANELFLSIKTIETYRDRIKQKLDLQNASELVHHAIVWSQRRSPT